MAFLKNLFGARDARHYADKADRLFADGRYAEARIAYDAALDKLDGDDVQLRDEIARKQGEAGNALATANIEEAERCLTGGDRRKAADHLALAGELAVDPGIAGKAALLAHKLGNTEKDGSPAATEEPATPSACSGTCTTAQPSPDHAVTDGHLSPEERFELMTAALPEELSRRYRSLGTRFAEAYLLAHDGSDAAASGLLASLDIPAARDILCYELALIRHRQGDARACETLLGQAIAANDRNPLCYIALVDLCAGSGRAEEALSLLDTMIDRQLLPEQAYMIKGDLLQGLELDEAALESYGALFMTPYKKEAATRAIPLLEKLGRSDEARQLFTRYVKGCC